MALHTPRLEFPKKISLYLIFYVALLVSPVVSTFQSISQHSSNPFESISSNVDELLTPWASAPFISITTHELMVKFLIMLYPLFCILIAIQAYVSYFGPSNEYTGNDGTRRSHHTSLLGSSLIETASKIIPYLTREYDANA